MLLTGSLSATELIEFAKNAKDPVKAACIEAIEFATREKPSLVNKSGFDFLSSALTDAAPAIKRESARAIANVAQLFTGRLDKATGRLLDNAQSHGTVVRWSSAYALSKILQADSRLNQEVLPAISDLCERETEKSIRKIYLSLLK
jgi:hypothetical protein